MSVSTAAARVQSLLDQAIEDGGEIGLQVAAYHKGDIVIDAWSGVADEESGRSVDGDTLFTVFSATKGITSTAIHILADRGLIEYDRPIAEFWPEFSSHGKGEITVRQALTHSAGIPQMPETATPELLADWDGICRSIADLKPLWSPGEKSGYHAYSFGWILGEFLHRVDGRPIAQFVQEEIRAPLAIDGLFLGIPASVEGRVATLKNPPAPPATPATPPRQPSPLLGRVIPRAVGLTADVFNRADIRRASFPAAGGIMNARSLARHYSCLAANGEFGGARILSEARIDTATELQFDTKDEVLQRRTRKALGYWLGGPDSQIGPWLTSFGHAGAGGALGFADRSGQLSFALTKNLIRAGQPGTSIAHRVALAIREELGLS